MKLNQLISSNNTISGFPEFLFNFGVQYNNQNLLIKLNSKYVGKFYSDNFDNQLTSYLIEYPGFIDYSDNINEGYFTMDLFASYEMNILNGLTNSKIFFQVNNIFDNLYSAYAIGKEFFPAADRNYIAGIQLGL